MNPESTPALRIREAVRAIVLDTADRILLVRFEFPGGTRWALPGGGIEPGESHIDALHRELAEEVGLLDAAIGEHVWSRLHIVPFINGAWDGQREQIHLVRTEPFIPEPRLTWEEMNAEYVFELRWWSVEEIETAATTFAPTNLAAHLRRLLHTGPENQPVDVSG